MERKYLVLAAGFLFLAILIFTVVNRFQFGRKTIPQGTKVVLETEVPSSAPAPVTEVQYKVTPVVESLYVPWSIVFTSNTRMLVTERNGNIREVLNEKLQTNPIFHFDEVAAAGEAGLMGMTLHPNYQNNKYVYVCVTYSGDGKLIDKIVRLIDKDSSLEKDKTIMDGIPAAQNHAGCRIKFGPDKKLYITSGDATTKTLPQDLNSLGGKILRINDDGSIPSDNPFPGSAIYSYGHRNPQGLAWTADGTMYETEHGPSGFDGPGGGDEVNIIKQGANYGWPVVSHTEHKDGMEDPLLVFTPAEAPSGMLYYSAQVFPQFQGNIFFAVLRGSGIFRITLDPDHSNIISSYEKMDIDVGRVRELEQGPDGLIYFATSNRDGRGKVRTGDDKIYKLEPEKN